MLSLEESVMDPEQIRKMNSWLQDRVTLATDTKEIAIQFDEPAGDDFLDEGFGEEAVKRTLGSDWWKEMVTDVVETPEFAEPDDTPEQVLQYARDLVVEYVSKRLYS
jgi:hypothetical protein